MLRTSNLKVVSAASGRLCKLWYFNVLRCIDKIMIIVNNSHATEVALSDVSGL